jgi:integrase
MTKLASQQSPHSFSKQEIEQIIHSNAKNKEVCFICQFLWYTGARISEVMEVKKKNIDLMNNIIYIKTKRRKKEYVRAVPLPQVFIHNIAKYLKTKQLLDGQKLFPFTERTAFNYVRKACIEAGIDDERAHPSSFRHSYALHCLSDGLKIGKVNEWLGNRDIKKTVEYYLDGEQNHQREDVNSIQW